MIWWRQTHLKNLVQIFFLQSPRFYPSPCLAKEGAKDLIRRIDVLNIQLRLLSVLMFILSLQFIHPRLSASGSGTKLFAREIPRATRRKHSQVPAMFPHTLRSSSPRPSLMRLATPGNKCAWWSVVLMKFQSTVYFNENFACTFYM